MQHAEQGGPMSPSRLLAAVVLLAPALSLAAKEKDDDEGSCTSFAEVSSNVWAYAGPIVKKAALAGGPASATAAQVASAVEQGIKQWNTLLAGNSWARIGPRSLEFGKPEKGNVVGVTERLFVSPMPAFRPVAVEVKKVDGDGRVRVVVCKVPEKGPAQVVRAFDFDDGDKDGKVEKVAIPDAAGHLIKVVLHGKKAVRSVKYEVSATVAD
jgi:hypothetical protein